MLLSFIYRFLCVICILYGKLVAMDLGEDRSSQGDLRNRWNSSSQVNSDESASLIIDLESSDTAYLLEEKLSRIPIDCHAYLLQFLGGKDIVSLSRVSHYQQLICYPYKLKYFSSLPAIDVPEQNVLSIEKYLRRYALSERFIYSTFFNRNKECDVVGSLDDKNKFHEKNYNIMHSVLCQAQMMHYSVQFRLGSGPEYMSEIIGRHEDLLIDLKFIDNSLKESLHELTTHDDIWKHGQSLYNNVSPLFRFYILDIDNPITVIFMFFKILWGFLFDNGWI